MERAEKAEAVEMLRGIFEASGVVVVSRYTGLTVAEMTALRARLRAADAGLRVVKNRLAKIALEGTPGEGARDLFRFPVAIAYSADPVAATKVAVDYAKTNDKFVVLGGILGSTVLNDAGVKALATLPSLDQLRAQLLGLIQAPATKVAGVVQAPAAQLARVIQAYATKDAA